MTCKQAETLPTERLFLVGYNPCMFRRLLLTCGLIIFLTACLPATSTLLPTLVRIPETVTPLSPARTEPTASQSTAKTTTPALTESSPSPQAPSTDIPLPLPPLEPPTLVATAVQQPSADSAAIQMLSPGPLSKIVSPVIVHGYAVPGHDNKGHLDLYGEDGRLLASQLLQLNTPYKWAIFHWELSFHTNSVGELGRLSLSTLDEYGRINSVNSVHLLLLSEGSSIINPPDNLQERCVIEKPVAGQRLSGGILGVSGKMRPYNNLPLTVYLVSRDGAVLGTGLVPIAPGPEAGYVPFHVEIPYRIPNAMWALLIVRQFDDRISGIMYLYSQEIFLNP
jgi:hypothetical protein